MCEEVRGLESTLRNKSPEISLPENILGVRTLRPGRRQRPYRGAVTKAAGNYHAAGDGVN